MSDLPVGVGGGGQREEKWEVSGSGSLLQLEVGKTSLVLAAEGRA